MKLKLTIYPLDSGVERYLSLISLLSLLKYIMQHIICLHLLFAFDVNVQQASMNIIFLRRRIKLNFALMPDQLLST